MLGTGATGIILECKNNNTNEIVAIKYYFDEDLDEYMEYSDLD